jgi:hypothetical protein
MILQKLAPWPFIVLALVDDIPMGWTIIDLVHQNQQTPPKIGQIWGVQPR